MSAVVWFIHFLRSIHQEVVWEVISAIFCFQGLRLILRWLRESRGHGPRGEAGTTGARAIQTLQQELGAARRSGYFRDRVMHRLRDLAIDVVSLQEGVKRSTARRLVAEGTWTNSAILREMTRHVPTTQTSEKISAPDGERFLTDVRDFLATLAEYPKAGETSGNGRFHGD